MAFIEIEKKIYGGGGRRGVYATYTALKDGSGSLRIGRAGMEFLKRSGKNWKLGDMVRIFHDPETGKLAVKKSESGRFRLAKNTTGRAGETLRITSRALRDMVKESTQYVMDPSGSDEYDAILTPRK